MTLWLATRHRRSHWYTPHSPRSLCGKSTRDHATPSQDAPRCGHCVALLAQAEKERVMAAELAAPLRVVGEDRVKLRVRGSCPVPVGGYFIGRGYDLG